jgi:CRISPR/Cas system CSM-associated protein Csm4 (group 5 of RAMP superfamily)
MDMWDKDKRKKKSEMRTIRPLTEWLDKTKEIRMYVKNVAHNIIDEITTCRKKRYDHVDRIGEDK